METILNQIDNGSSLDTFIGKEEEQNCKGLKSWRLKASSSTTFSFKNLKKNFQPRQ